jgi:hypothetical protein
MSKNNDYKGKLCITPHYRRVFTPLSNQYETLCHKLAELVKMYDLMAKQMPEGETRDLAEDISEQIITALSLTDGCSPINSDHAFDSRRHTPVPFSLVEEGTPIESFLRMGIAFDDIVLIPAKVKIKAI